MKMIFEKSGVTPDQEVDLLESVLAKCSLDDLVDWVGKEKDDDVSSLDQTEAAKMEMVRTAIEEGKLSSFKLGDERMEWFEWKDELNEKWIEYKKLDSFKKLENAQETKIKITESVSAICAIIRKEHWEMVESLPLGPDGGRLLDQIPSEYTVREVAKKWLSKQRAQPIENINFNGPFSNQPALVRGTGFLIGHKYLLTAAHVLEDQNGMIDDPLLQTEPKLRYVFNYYCESEGVLSSNVFAVNGILRQKGQAFWDDWAVIELEDDPRLKDLEPLKLSRAFKPVVPNASLFSWGFPMGTPMKVSLMGKKLFNLIGNRFTTNLDMSGGNSGSPVFSKNKGKLVHGLMLEGVPEFEAKSVDGGENVNGPRTYERRELTIGDIFRLKAGEHCQSMHSIHPQIKDFIEP